MQLVKKINTQTIVRFLNLLTICILIIPASKAQDNSPYSRYGLGDLTHQSHVINTGMGGVSAAYVDPFGATINFNNPATFSQFNSFYEKGAKKMSSGRVVLDIGVNLENRILKDPKQDSAGFNSKFTASNALFSYIQIGVPLNKQMGICFGLKPISRISYKIFKNERLIDPVTGKIDSTTTNYLGSGGTYLASIGTGYKLNNFSIGINVGYLFGKKNIQTIRDFINDSVLYANEDYETNTSFGKLHINVGLQYKIEINKSNSLTLGAFGNIGQNLNASQDILRQTYIFDNSLGILKKDSVFEVKNVAGKVYYPSSFTFGFMYDKKQEIKTSGWSIGVDFTSQNWNSYRYYGASDYVQNNWNLRIGGQFHPISTTQYLSHSTYRFGANFGKDYINAGGKLPLWGVSFGMSLPLANFSSISRNQFSIINWSLEYLKRGNNSNALKESMYRFTLGFSFSDLWFHKRKYE